MAESYDEVIRAWFNQVDNARGRLISVQLDRGQRGAADRRGPYQLGGQGADREVSVGRHADREALRALLPHQRVEFVAADTTG